MLFRLLVVFSYALQAMGAINKSGTEVSIRECLLIHQPGSLGYCIGNSALSKLRSFDTSSEFDLVDGLTFTRDEKMYREGYNSVLEESDPNDFRSVVDSFGQVFARRSMNWDMGFIYPGLSLRVAPSGGIGGVLEFSMDPLQEATFSQHALKEASTGQILARQFLVPLLLGFKFNIATLIPVIFGLIALIAKKAVVLSKIALVISSAFSLGSLLFPSYAPTPGYGGVQHSYVPHYNPHQYRFQDDDYQESSYRGNTATPTNVYNDQDQIRLYDDRLQQAFSREDSNSAKKGRNFAWSEAEKKIKPLPGAR